MSATPDRQERLSAVRAEVDAAVARLTAALEAASGDVAFRRVEKSIRVAALAAEAASEALSLAGTLAGSR